MVLIEIMVGMALFCPLVILMLSFFVFLKMRMKKRFALGFAADLTTFVLFFSVPLVLQSVWGNSYVLPLLMVLLCLGLAVTFLDWRTKKEIEVLILLKKIWRIYFLVLSTLYLVACVAGIVVNVLVYIETP